MIPPIPQPDPLPLPAPSWLLWGLLMLTFVLHLVPMNLVLGGSLVAAIARIRSRGGARPHEAELAHRFVKAMPVLIAATVTMGVAALLFLQVLFGRLFFVSSILMGWWWLAVVLLVMLAYYGAYLLSLREQALGSAAPVVAWGIAAVVTVVAFIYSHNMALMLRSGVWADWYAADGRGLALRLSDATLLPRYLHMFLGAVAVTGVAIAGLGAWRRAADAEWARWAVRYGAAICAGATTINVVTGLWWLAVLPRPVIRLFMGRDVSATVILIAGILLTVGAAVHLVLAARSRTRMARLVWNGTGSMAAGVVLMVLTRDTVRRASLGDAGFVPVTWVAPQWGPIIVFVVALIVAAGSVAWMVRALVRGSRTGGA